MPDPAEPLLVTVSVDEASDSWGFVGVVRIGDLEIYRTLEAFRTPAAAQRRTTRLIADLLGEFLAGQDLRAVRQEPGRTPSRRQLARRPSRAARQPVGSSAEVASSSSAL